MSCLDWQNCGNLWLRCWLGVGMFYSSLDSFPMLPAPPVISTLRRWPVLNIREFYVFLSVTMVKFWRIGYQDLMSTPTWKLMLRWDIYVVFLWIPSNICLASRQEVILVKILLRVHRFGQITCNDIVIMLFKRSDTSSLYDFVNPIFRWQIWMLNQLLPVWAGSCQWSRCRAFRSTRSDNWKLQRWEPGGFVAFSPPWRNSGISTIMCRMWNDYL